MRYTTKILAVALVLTIFVGTVSVHADQMFSDVSGDGKAAVEILATTGIIVGYEDGTFRGDRTVTRAEFAAIICRMLGREVPIEQNDTKFTDVPKSHWASGYIALAAEKGIILGYGDGLFLPENPVKYEEAIKMLVSRLGYEPKAREQGGYPMGYVSVAEHMGVLKGSKGTLGTSATRLTVAIICCNALDVNFAQ